MSSVAQSSVDPATQTIFRAKKKRLGKHSYEFYKKDTIATTADVTLITLLLTLNRNLLTGKTPIAI